MPKKLTTPKSSEQYSVTETMLEKDEKEKDLRKPSITDDKKPLEKDETKPVQENDKNISTDKNLTEMGNENKKPEKRESIKRTKLPPLDEKHDLKNLKDMLKKVKPKPKVSDVEDDKDDRNGSLKERKLSVKDENESDRIDNIKFKGTEKTRKEVEDEIEENIKPEKELTSVDKEKDDERSLIKEDKKDKVLDASKKTLEKVSKAQVR